MQAAAMLLQAPCLGSCSPPAPSLLTLTCPPASPPHTACPPARTSLHPHTCQSPHVQVGEQACAQVAPWVIIYQFMAGLPAALVGAAEVGVVHCLLLQLEVAALHVHTQVHLR